MDSRSSLAPLLIAIIGGFAQPARTHSARVLLVQSVEGHGTTEPAARTDEEEQADHAARQGVQKINAVIKRHGKELNLPGVVGVYVVEADPYHQWIRVMVKELTPQLANLLPTKLEGVWVQVVDKTRYDQKVAAAVEIMNGASLLKLPGVEAVGIGGNPYDMMDIWIVVSVDKLTPQVESEIPAELGGFPVHFSEIGGPIILD